MSNKLGFEHQPDTHWSQSTHQHQQCFLLDCHEVGDTVAFMVHWNQRGQPQASVLVGYQHPISGPPPPQKKNGGMWMANSWWFLNATNWGDEPKVYSDKYTSHLQLRKRRPLLQYPLSERVFLLHEFLCVRTKGFGAFVETLLKEIESNFNVARAMNRKTRLWWKQ